VLDVGCAVGALGCYLSQANRCVVDGIEANIEAAEIARPYYRQIFTLDLESDELKGVLVDKHYDVIVCADILEHLRDPGALLMTLTPLLAPGGRFLISTPNVGHLGVIMELLDGDFRYRKEGILDATHLRFFTRQSLLRMLDEHGLCAEIVDTTVTDLAHSEFDDQHRQELADYLFAGSPIGDDFFSYQFIASAVPKLAETESEDPTTNKSPESVGPISHSQIYWRTVDEAYDEQRSATASSARWHGEQLLRLEIPRSPLLRMLRINLSDVPGVVALHSLRYLQGDNEIWRWDPATGDPFRSDSYHHLIRLNDESATPALYMLSSIPAWAEVTAQIPGSPTETCVEMKLTAVPPAASLELIRSYLSEVDERTRATIADITLRRDADRITRERILKSRIRYLERERRELFDDFGVRIRQHEEKEALLEQRIADLLSSTSWRLTAPVRLATEQMLTRLHPRRQPGLDPTSVPEGSHDRMNDEDS
jgi:SAM-dependent methyltransferase